MNAETREETFQTPGPVRLRVEVPKGRVSVTAAETAQTTIELTAVHGDEQALEMIAQAEVSQDGEVIVVRIRREHWTIFGFGGDVRASVRVPFGSAAHIWTGAGAIETHGRLGEVDAQSGAGAICVDDSAEVKARSGAGAISIATVTGSVDVKSGAGRVSVGQVGGNARIATGAGSAELAGAVGDAKVTSAAGNIDVAEAGDSLEAVTHAGTVRVHHADHGRVSAKTMAGSIFVGVAKGAAAFVDVSTMRGRVNSELESTEAPAAGDKRVELIIRTMSGNVNLARA